ncbi:hypothetical protein J6590_018319 [Homalodisca vitripennis]|nr:hypothetical protein J6590_018319 [Homalodisca vitripennis]
MGGANPIDGSIPEGRSIPVAVHQLALVDRTVTSDRSSVFCGGGPPIVGAVAGKTGVKDKQMRAIIEPVCELRRHNQRPLTSARSSTLHAGFGGRCIRL